MDGRRVPALELLWEDGDPRRVLADRFGLDDAPAADRWVSDLLDEHWGVRVEACERVVMSDANSLAWLVTPGGRVLAKWSVAPARFARLARVARLTGWLNAQGLPVSPPVPALTGGLQLEVEGVSVGVQHVVDADLLDVGDPAQVRAAGAVLARLHLALAAYPDADLVVAPTPPPAPLRARVTAWLDGAGDRVPRAARDAVRREVAAAPAADPAAQLVHGDFRSSNVLCSGPDVAAVLDLEEARSDQAVVELARSAVMLGTRFRDWGPVSAEVREGFRAGYESVRPLTAAEAGWWDVLVLWHAWLLVPPGADPTGWRAAAEDLLEQ